MHGEYRPPGGKLVGADVEVADGRLAGVQISGDFFLKPNDALERLNAALTGVPRRGRPRDYDGITAALGGAVLAGFTAGRWPPRSGALSPGPAAGATTTGSSSRRAPGSRAAHGAR